MMTCEEAYLLAKFAKSLNKRVTLGLGPVPMVGEDDRYPKDAHGNPPAFEATKFTIRAEKCPNRRGVEMILQHYQGSVIDFATSLQSLQPSKYTSAYVVGGYPGAWFDETWIPLFKTLNWLFVQDFLQSALTDIASILLPSATFAEREGTVINHAGLAQLIRPAIRVTDNAWLDGRILHELSQRPGMFNASVVRREMAQEIPSFSLLATSELSQDGLFLSQATLAGVK